MSTARRWIAGVDEPLPEGEEILWSGSPEVRATTRHVVHVRVWGAYMAAMVVLVGVSALSSLSIADTARVLVLPLLLTAVLLGAVAWLGRAVARSSTYVVTTRRVILQVGIAFPIAINIPLRLIDNAALKRFRDGSGELRLTLAPEVKLAYIALWPHVDVFRNVANPRPKLRGLADPERVGQVIRDAVVRSGGNVRVGDADETRALIPGGGLRVGANGEAMAR